MRGGEREKWGVWIKRVVHPPMRSERNKSQSLWNPFFNQRHTAQTNVRGGSRSTLLHFSFPFSPPPLLSLSQFSPSINSIPYFSILGLGFRHHNGCFNHFLWYQIGASIAQMLFFLFLSVSFIHCFSRPKQKSPLSERGYSLRRSSLWCIICYHQCS